MRTAEGKVGIDSNVLSYLATAMSGEYDPSSDVSRLRDERVAVYRVFLYDHAKMCVTPTVKSECADVPRDRLKALHDAISDVLLLDGPWHLDETRLDARVTDLLLLHDDENDCRILAEAEQAGFDALLTFDANFIKRLHAHGTGPVLSSPSIYWQGLALPPGAPMKRRPAISNPMSAHRWWQV